MLKYFLKINKIEKKLITRWNLFNKKWFMLLEEISAEWVEAKKLL